MSDLQIIASVLGWVCKGRGHACPQGDQGYGDHAFDALSHENAFLGIEQTHLQALPYTRGYPRLKSSLNEV